MHKCCSARRGQTLYMQRLATWKEAGMLEEMIMAYEKALEAGKKATMLSIERKLRMLGMDKASLMVIVRERRKERGE